jgi:hypothetical protein
MFRWLTTSPSLVRYWPISTLQMQIISWIGGLAPVESAITGEHWGYVQVTHQQLFAIKYVFPGDSPLDPHRSDINQSAPCICRLSAVCSVEALSATHWSGSDQPAHCICQLSAVCLGDSKPAPPLVKNLPNGTLHVQIISIMFSYLTKASLVKYCPNVQFTNFLTYDIEILIYIE